MLSLQRRHHRVAHLSGLCGAAEVGGVVTRIGEDLGDRVNTVEWSEMVAAEEIEAALDPSPIGGLLTGGRRPYRWKHAA